MPEYTPDPTDAVVDGISVVLKGVYRDSAGEAIDAFGLAIDWDHVEPMAQTYAETHGAELVGRHKIGNRFVENPNARWAITDTQRERVNELLQEAVDKGWSMDRFADRLTESGLFERERAEMIARTETAIAQNKGQTDAMRAAGVDRVYVYDGDEDDECQEADGSIWTIDHAAANPTSHPNCVRAFSAVPDSDTTEPDE